MDKFLSCDWGTSSFRLRLVLADKLTVVAELKNGQGIAATYKAWQSNNSSDREGFYIDIIRKQVKVLNRQVGMALDGIPVVLSGMASSSMGLADLPYKQMPFNLDGSDLEVKVIDGDKDSNPLIIISGACTATDAMRGEETKTVGCASHLSENNDDILLVLPGTHPKHIIINSNKATNVTTYMTGEFFDLLATKSVLAASVDEGGNINDPANKESFITGVNIGANDNLLHSSFMIRTNQLLKQLPQQQNFYYLSGLLIGTELKDIHTGRAIYLVSGRSHLVLYKLACEVLGISIAGEIDADKALIKGQQVVFSRYYK